MSDAADSEADAELEEAPDPADGDGGDEEVPIEDDELADVSLGDIDPEEIGQSDTDDDSGAERAESDATSDADDAEGEVGAALGDLYVDTLAVVLAAIVEEHGDDPDMDAEDIAELARQPPMHLNEYVDEAAANALGGADLPPGKAAVLMTGILCVTVLVKETDVASDAVASASENLRTIDGEGTA